MQIRGWEDIRDEVMARIRRRDWQPGALIPGEEALAAEFGCSRATVNRALGELARDGTLERRRKAGTRVAALPSRRAMLTVPVIRHEVEARGQSYAFHLISQTLVEAPVPVISRLGMPAGSHLLHLRTLHLADGRPWLFEDRWINPAVLPEPSPDFRVVTANEWLLGHVPFTTGDIGLSAAGASAEEAAIMELAPGTAVFVLDRTTWDGDCPVTLVRQIYAPGYRMQTSL